MEAKKLRIGNLVNTFSLNEVTLKKKSPRKIVKITALGTGHISYEGIDGLPCNFMHESLEPIALTREWFISLGFSQYHKNLFVKGYVAVNFYLLFEYYFISFENRRIILTHVHELQNLFFALTGEELELKTDSSTCR